MFYDVSWSLVSSTDDDDDDDDMYCKCCFTTTCNFITNYHLSSALMLLIWVHCLLHIMNQLLLYSVIACCEYV